jgi:hypothetical protein
MFTMEREWAESITSRMILALENPSPLVGRYNAVTELVDSINRLSEFYQLDIQLESFRNEDNQEFTCENQSFYGDKSC